MNSAEAPNLTSFYAYKNTFDRDSVWLDIPSTGENFYPYFFRSSYSSVAVTFVNVQDPYTLPSSPELDEEPTRLLHSLNEHHARDAAASHTLPAEPAETPTGGLEALSAAALYMPSEAGMMQGYGQYPEDNLEDLQSPPMDDTIGVAATLSPQIQTGLTPSSGNLDFILNPTSTLSSSVDPSLGSLESIQERYAHRRPDNVPGAQAKASTETSHKIAFLMRHFSETTGRWYVDDASEKLHRFSY